MLHPSQVVMGENGPALIGDGALFMWADNLAPLLAAHPHVQLVLSTSWARHLPFERVRDCLPVALRRRVVGSTWHRIQTDPTFSQGLPYSYWQDATRYQQVRRWVTLHRLRRWAAIDDDADGKVDEGGDLNVDGLNDCTQDLCGKGQDVVLARLFDGELAVIAPATGSRTVISSGIVPTPANMMLSSDSVNHRVWFEDLYVTPDREVWVVGRRAVTILSGEITKFLSSPGVERGFCSRCGSTLTCSNPRLPGETHFHIGRV